MPTGGYGSLSDLWEFNPSTNEWAWMGGSSTVPAVGGGQAGVYGTLDTPSATGIPGGRLGASSWTDGSGYLWLFGGQGLDSTGSLGYLNDVWRYQPYSLTV